MRIGGEEGGVIRAKFLEIMRTSPTFIFGKI